MKTIVKVKVEKASDTSASWVKGYKGLIQVRIKVWLGLLFLIRKSKKCVRSPDPV